MPINFTLKPKPVVLSTICSDDVLRSFWEIEEPPRNAPAVFSLEEQAVMRHFESGHRQSSDGRYEVPLPRKAGVKPLGESRSQAVRRFFSLERSLRQKNRFQEVDEVVREIFPWVMLRLSHQKTWRSHQAKSSIFPCTWYTRILAPLQRSEPSLMHPLSRRLVLP